MSVARSARGVAAPRPARRRIDRPGRLVPPSARHLKARAVRLPPGGTMDWHTTGDREELLLATAGRVVLEIDSPPRAGRSSSVRHLTVEAGQTVFLPQRVVHRVVNRTSSIARYVYVTGGVNPPAST